MTLFTETIFVFKYSFIFMVLGDDTATPGSMWGPQRCDRGVTGGRSLSVHTGHSGNIKLC